VLVPVDLTSARCPPADPSLADARRINVPRPPVDATTPDGRPALKTTTFRRHVDALDAAIDAKDRAIDRAIADYEWCRNPPPNPS
jgi:hypothetical protein